MKRTETRTNNGNVEKKCRTCQEFKPLTEFHQAAACSYGVQNKCKECCKVEYLENRDTVLARQKEYASNNKEIISERNFKNHLKVRYNLTPEEHAEMCKDGCMICGVMEDLAVDHDHDTNEVRGILCRACNKALGIFKDDANLLLKAAAYLESRSSYRNNIPSIRSNGK